MAAGASACRPAGPRHKPRASNGARPRLIRVCQSTEDHGSRCTWYRPPCHRHPLGPSSLVEVFSETYIPDRETLSSATGAKRGFASDRHRTQPQDVVVANKDASRVRAQRTRPITFLAVALGVPVRCWETKCRLWQFHRRCRGHPGTSCTLAIL